MQVTTEKAGPCVAKVSFTVPAADFENEVRRALTNIGRNVRMKGFRPGKVPAHVIEKTHGESVRKEAMGHFVQQAYRQAIQENDLKPIGFERVNPETLLLSLEGDFSHEFEVSLRPEFELGQYRSLEIESQLAQTMDEEVDAAIEDVKRQRSTPEPIAEDDDNGLEENGLALVKLVWTVEEENVLEREGLRISPLDTPPGIDADAFHDALIGKKKDESFELPLTIPEGFEKPELVGKEGVCLIELQETLKLVPPSDEEIFTLFEVEDEAALKATVRERIDQAKQNQEDQRIEAELLGKLIDSHEMDLPEQMVLDQKSGRIAQLRQELEGRGLSEEQIDEEAAKQDEAAHEAATKGMKALFLVQRIAEKEELLLSREEIEAEYQSIAERNNAQPDEVRKYYEENHMVEQMGIELLERKVRSFLREHAVVNDPS